MIADPEIILELSDPLPDGWNLRDDELILPVNDLSERNMTASDRASFMNAKVRELSSFFENDVWKFTSGTDADEDRTLRGRWLLKWSKDEAGQPKAKARLVIQGFRDPDALAGTIETNSPTAARVSKHVMLSIAAIMSWPLWCADVSTAFLQG